MICRKKHGLKNNAVIFEYEFLHENIFVRLRNVTDILEVRDYIMPFF